MIRQSLYFIKRLNPDYSCKYYMYFSCRAPCFTYQTLSDTTCFLNCRKFNLLTQASGIYLMSSKIGLIRTPNNFKMITIKTEQILKEKFVEMSFDPENKIVEAKWIGFLKEEEVRKACKVMINFIGKNKITKHLSDQTQLKVLSKEVQNYLVGECFPELDKQGLKKVAVLVSEDVFAQATVNNVNTKSQMGGLTFGTFNSKNKSIEFLNA